MGTAHANIWLRNANCELLPNVWRTDLVIQGCPGSYLVDLFPEVIDQLKERYSTSASMICTTDFPLGTDQAGKTLGLTFGSGSVQNLAFSAPAMKLEEIVGQMKAFFKDCEIAVIDGSIVVKTTEHGPGVSITVSGDSDLTWSTVKDGEGYKIVSHFYQNAKRIMLMPPSGENINHIEVDIPPGCYRVWTRVCHGNNEETSIQMINPRCGEEVCVNLLLPTIETCSAHLVHPLMDHIVVNQKFDNDANRVMIFRGLIYGAQLAKQVVLDQLAYRLEEAEDKNDTDLQARVNAVIALANQLPDCY